MGIKKERRTDGVETERRTDQSRQYELVVIMGPDHSIGQVRDSVKVIENVVLEQEGKVEAVEYWGFRTTAYPIKKRNKAHYIFLGLTLKPSALKELSYCLKFKLRQEVVRFLLLKCPGGLQLPTPLFHSSLADAVAGGYQSDEDGSADEVSPPAMSNASVSAVSPV